MIDLTTLQSFVLNDELTISEGKGGLPCIVIDNKHARATISIYGAHVLSYIPKAPDNSNDLLFVSDCSFFEKGKAIRGGIPVCWPWFGKDANDPDKARHGFVRLMLWEIDETKSLSDGSTQVQLSIKDSEKTREIWPYHFKLTLTIVIGKTLNLSLRSENTGEVPFNMTQALHTYFAVADINKVQLNGLENVHYFDKVTFESDAKLQLGSINIDQEVDRIYTDTPEKLTLLVDAKKQVSIQSAGHNTTVVWNPWIDKTKSSEDLSDNAYQQFICVETTNAVDEIVVTPKQSYTLTADYLLS